jgi:hypothetical protein
MTGFIELFDTEPDYNLQYTVTQTHIHTLSTVASSLPLLGSGFQRWTFPFLWVPKLTPASASNSSSSQRLNRNSPLTKRLLCSSLFRCLCITGSLHATIYTETPILHTLALKVEVACTSETSATSPISTRCNNRKRN